MRDNNWLEDKMYTLWENYFVDVPRVNPVIIRFGKKSERQLGSIKWADHRTTGLKKVNVSEKDHDDSRISIITITGHFKDEYIPEQVILGTIAHEMCHYAHGFNSPLQQIYAHPHKGGVIRKEMQKRGLSEVYKDANRWLKENWSKYLKA